MAELGIRDVAQRAGVSPATVSRVLNGSTTVRPEYADRVTTAIAELGYRPNRLARNLRRRSAEMIGVVVSDIENPHFTASVRAIEDAAYQRGYRMLLCNTDEKADKQREYLELMADERVLGVIMSPTNAEGDEIGRMLDLDIPVVAIDRRVSDPRADSVIADNEAAARVATEHLLAAGHRRIALVAGRRGTETASQRSSGYEKAIAAAGSPQIAVDGEFRIESARLAVTALLERDPEVTALVVGNNLMAVGTLRALASAGRKVPEDIAVVGIDDPFWAELVHPPMTVLAQPVRAMADMAMRLLLERISGQRAEPRAEVFECELRVRGSCGTALLKESEN